MIHSNPTEIANIINNYFCSVFTADDGSNCTMSTRTIHKLEKITFTPDRIYHTLRNLKPSFSSGPDGFTNSFLRNCAAGLTLSLSHIFNLSFNVHEIPLDWSSA